MPPPGQSSIIRERLGETHADAGAEAGGKADSERVNAAVGRERRGKQRRERRDRSIHQTGQPRLDDLQDEQPFLPGGVLLAQLCLGHLLGRLGVVTLLFGQVA